MSLGLDDLIITKNSNNETICGGFKVNNILLNSNNPALITMNSSKKPLNKVSSLFDDLAVPAGLLFINDKMTPRYSEKTDRVIDETLYDKLFNLANINSKKQSKKRIKINPKKSTKNKTSKRR
ncbi:hypothetical protein CL646_05550 [bacterium]|nr:hypothetical protein [bacterium]|tara:strand:- start:5 stop:373 length:369 start_codon:yes stop_codon:yes gene_type:complete